MARGVSLVVSQCLRFSTEISVIWHEQVLQIVLAGEIHFGHTKFSCNMVILITDKIGLIIKTS